MVKSIFDTVIHTATPAEIKAACKDPGIPKHSMMRINGQPAVYNLYDNVTLKPLTWKGRGKSSLKKWFAKKCPTVSHDYTLRDLLVTILTSPIFFGLLLTIWVAVNIYVYYNKTDENEDYMLIGLIAASLVCHFMYYLGFASYFQWRGLAPDTILYVFLLLLSPIIPAAATLIINGLNSNGAKISDTVKEYLEYYYMAGAGFYAVLGAANTLFGQIPFYLIRFAAWGLGNLLSGR